MGAPRENSSCQRNRMYSRKSHRDRYELVTLLYANESAIIRPIYMHIDVRRRLVRDMHIFNSWWLDDIVSRIRYVIHQWFMSHNGIGVSTVPRYASRPISLEVRSGNEKRNRFHQRKHQRKGTRYWCADAISSRMDPKDYPHSVLALAKWSKKSRAGFLARTSYRR